MTKGKKTTLRLYIVTLYVDGSAEPLSNAYSVASSVGAAVTQRISAVNNYSHHAPEKKKALRAASSLHVGARLASAAECKAYRAGFAEGSAPLFLAPGEEVAK